MNSESEVNESYGEVYDKITRVVNFMEERDGKKPSFEDCFIEMIKTKELSVVNLEFQIPRYAEVWQDIGLGYADYIPLLELVKEQSSKRTSKKRESVLKPLKTFIKKQRFIPVIDTNKSRPLMQKLSFAIVAVSLGVVLGFYFKTPDTILMDALVNSKSEWEYDSYIEFMKSEIPFFYLENDNAQYEIEIYGKFKFNWLAFYLGLFLIYLTFLINKYFDFKSILNPYLKKDFRL